MIAGMLLLSGCATPESVTANNTKKGNIMSDREIAKFDKAMGYKNEAVDGMDWYSVDAPNVELTGLYWRKPGEAFRRIPFTSKVSDGVDFLAWNTAGVMLRFRTDSQEIKVNVKVGHACRMDHMAHVGIMGFDIYLGSGSSKFYAGSTRFDHNKDEYNVKILEPFPTKKMREFTIHFPLYSGVESFRLGVNEGSVVELPTPWKDPRPVVVYGTSIQQGGCASRPGMCHTNQMSRMLDRPFINLAFSGSGKGEPEMAELIAQIKDPAMIVLDYDANAHCDGLEATLPTFIDIIRKAHPEVPILLVSRLPFKDEFLETNEYKEDRFRYTAIHMAELKRRRDMGDKNIHFLDGSTLYGPDPSECTVDGCHATDLGFYQISKRMAPVIERILTQF